MASDSDSGGPEVLQAAIAAADEFQQRIGHRNAQVRRRFVGRPSPDDPVPMLARIMRSGRGSPVRLKLLLSLLWVAVGSPHTVTFPARTWAELLGLAEPETRGARQVRSGLDWMVRHRLVLVEEKPGQASTVTLLDETGVGALYLLPGRAISEARKNGRPVNEHDFYLKVPPEFWTCGWTSRLSGPAVAMLLLLLDATRSNGPERELWFSPRVAAERYALSEGTRSRGFQELEEVGLVTVRRRPVSRTTLDYRRLRNTYLLNTESLKTPPV